MELTFGGRLRQQREAQQISLAAIAADTKIKLSLLEGLERDDLSRWPARIYRRAYVRSYARAIGLDPETVVREFLELYPDPVEPSPEDLAAAVDAGNGMSPVQSGTIFRRLVSSAFGSVPAFLQRSDRSDTAAAPQPASITRSTADHAAAPPGRESSAPRDTWTADGADEGKGQASSYLGDLVIGSGPDTAATGGGVTNRDGLSSDFDFRIGDDRHEDSVADGGLNAGVHGGRNDDAAEGGEAAEPIRGLAAATDRQATTAPRRGPATFDQFARTRDDGGPREFSLTALAGLCTRLGQVVERRDLLPLLEEAALLLDAVGLIVWAWDRDGQALRASVAHGYSDAVLAQWPGVPLDAENGIASAYRSASPCVVDGGGGMTGAVVVPLLGPHACAGVLALELRNGGERRDSVQAAATILAAQLVALLGPSPIAEAVNS